MRRIAKIGAGIVLTPVVLVLLLAIALYIPPIQKWAVDKASEYASEETGMDITVGGVHLAFPLDLSLEEVLVRTPSDSPQGGENDTILHVKQAIVDVQLWPLLKKEVVVNELEINETHVNTMDLIDAARIKGYIGQMKIDNTPPPVASVSLDSSVVRLSSVMLADAKLQVEIPDSVPEDTTESENLWKIYVRDVAVNNVNVNLNLNPNTNSNTTIAARLGDVRARDGFFDLEKGLYQVGHAEMAKSAFDYNNKEVWLADLGLTVDSIYYCDPDIRAKVREGKGTLTLANTIDRLPLRLRADVAIDSAKMLLDGNVATPSSHMALNVKMRPNPVSNLDLDNGHIDAKIDGEIGHGDLARFVELKGAPRYPIAVKGEAHGNMTQMRIPQMKVNWPTVTNANLNLNLNNLADTKRMSAQMHVEAQTYNLNFVKGMLDRSTAKMINLPQMRTVADVNYSANGNYSADATIYEGRSVVKAKVNGNANSSNLNADIKAKNLNVAHFVNRNVGFDTRLLSNVDATASVHNSQFTVHSYSHGKDLNGNVNVNGYFGQGGKGLTALTLTTDMQRINLMRLGMSENPLSIALCGHMDVETDLNKYYRVQGMVSDIAITDSAKTYHVDDVVLDVLTSRDTTAAKVDCGDFAMKMNAQGGYEWLLGCTDRMSAVIDKLWQTRTIDQQAIRNALPRMTLSVQSGQENPVYRIAKAYDVDYRQLDLSLRTSREDGIFGDMRLDGLRTQGYKLDTVRVSINSKNDPMKISYQAQIINRPPNDYVFNAKIDGTLLDHGLVAGVRLWDKDDKMALRLGAEATMEENGIRLHLVPTNPTLGYDVFTLNDDNYILLTKKNRIYADIDLLASDGTGVKVYSAQLEEDDDNGYLQDLTLSVNKLNIGRLLSALPYAVNAEGIMDGDFHVVQNPDETFAISSDLNIKNMLYEGCELGNVGTEFTYMPKGDGSHYIDGVIYKDETEVGTLTGTYNATTDYINAKMHMQKFPLMLVNGFIPDQIIGLEGTAEGTLAIQGTTKKPQVDGELLMEDAALLSVPYGVRLRMDNDPVRIQNSRLLLDNFQLYAPNDEPLVAQGEVDFADTDHMKVNLRMRAKNFQLINAKETSRSETYGEMYVNFLMSVRGELDKLNVRGKIDVLPSTNLYYVLRDSPITTDNQLKDLVTFTDLQNGDSIAVTRPTIDGMDMVLSVGVQEGAHIKCWLDGAHNNYLDLIGNGDLKYSYVNEETKLTGRYTITEGEMKYSLPVIPLKTFTIEDGSYLEWSGDMMNPRLHITAMETTKASVSMDGVNQMVTFRTGVKLSKTLNDMGLEFLIESPENQTIADELSMKSAEERGKLAVTLLTTGMYLSDGNTSKFSMNSALNSFLQSQINTIAGNALKTIDLSFGMESSTEQDGTMHNDYTFKFAKRFWNNRLSIAVGGKVSSGPDVSGQNKSFFNNVELQYRLSEQSNKYLQMYYKRNVYDYLEGYLSEYGAGYLWKKKAQTLKGIFGKDPIYMPFRRDTTRGGAIRKDSIK